MRFSWSLGPSPREPTVVWPRRDTPTADCVSGAKQRRHRAVSPSNSSIVLLLLLLLLLVDVDKVLNLETSKFRFEKK